MNYSALLPCLLASAALILPGCSNSALVLMCRETSNRFGNPSTWVVRVDPAKGVAEMGVDVPADSVAAGVPPGARRGTVFANERAYEITIPLDEGGSGSDKWFRPTFAFDIDRYTSSGNAFVGGKTAEAVPIPIQCDAVPDKPRF